MTEQPVTRLGRVIQQLRSFGDLHANELEGIAQELDVAGANDVASRLRAYRDLQRDEAQLVVDELADIHNDMASAAEPIEPPPANTASHDPAVNSPRRAKWLAEKAERATRPLSRRDLFGRRTTEDP